MPFDPQYADAIASVESGGNYSILGPETKGDRAYGKYQIMGSNIGPWSKEILGQEVTPEQFLANPQLQDAVFQGKFGQYVDKYGPEGASKAWFAGERGMNNPNAKDVLGTSVAGYGAKFMKALGQPQGAPPVPVSFQGAPRPILPQNNAPAAIPEAQPSQPEAQPSYFGQVPAEAGAPPPPIFAPPRKPVNLSRLRSALQARPSGGFFLARG